MGIFKKKQQAQPSAVPAGVAVQTGNRFAAPYGLLSGTGRCQMRLYRQLRESVPLIDSAINKIVRLMGGFHFETGNRSVDRELERFFALLPVGCGQTGIQAFADCYMEQLLTYGTAVGEMLADEHGFYGLYTAPLGSVEIRLSGNGIYDKLLCASKESSNEAVIRKIFP